MISSKQNVIFKRMKKLLTKKYSDLYQQFLVFGKHLIEEAKKTNSIVEIFTTNRNHFGTLISSELMQDLKQTKTLYEEVAICKHHNQFISSNNILALENIQDPANLGVLLRSALAFGFKHILLSDNSANVYNEKTIRASQGAFFYLYIERGNLSWLLNNYKAKNYKILSTLVSVDQNTIDIKTYDKTKYLKKILVLGNEGAGISKNISLLSDIFLNIATQTVESLNVAVAGSILMYYLS